MQDKLKNWEELCNDGENYGGEGENLSSKEKILFENIKDKKILKIQDAYLFSKTGKIEEDHGRKLAELIAHFPFVKTISSLRINISIYIMITSIIKPNYSISNINNQI